MERLTVEMLDGHLKLNLYDLLQLEKRRKYACDFIDCRVWISEGKGAFLENGTVKGMGENYSGEFNVRVIAGNPVRAPGYDGQTFGARDFPQLLSLIASSIETAYRRALASSAEKNRRKEKWGPLGEALWSMELAMPQKGQLMLDSVPATYTIDPRSVSLDAITALLKDVSALIKDRPRIRYQIVAASTTLIREFIVGTFGACIDQTFAITEAPVLLVASEGSVQQEHMDYLAHQRGWEIMETGINEELTQLPPYREFARLFAQELSELCVSPPCPTIRDAIVVTEPHFNTLKVHEIVGHPTELDRILKMETGYAGRSWLFHGFDEHMVGKKVASPLVSAYSDPQLPGFGYYKYDHEGVLGQRVVHIEAGVLRGFMSSAQTAAVFGGESNGHWRASRGDMVPLIRMSNTVFAPGDRNPDDIIREIDRGYLLAGHAIPSIAESRENFRILARRVHEIRDGKIGQLFRDGGIMADSLGYLTSVDAIGNDFRLYPIPNCGKGSPMQVKKLGNGGPTMRARATLIGPSGEAA